MAEGYPIRPAFWALRVIRCLQKTGAANHIGRDAAWLITTIATMEDTKRYSEPVAFWNNHLMDVTGFGHKGTFLKARAAAVAAGWLVYEEGRKGHAARYWTAIPEAAQQFIGADVLENAGSDSDPQTECRSENGPTTGPESGPETGPETGPHSLPIPDPIPERVGASLPSHPKPKFQRPTIDEVRAYAAERGACEFDAEHFVDHYDSNGWKVGKAAMKDWQATVRKWIRSGGTPQASTAARSASGAAEAEAAWQTVIDSLRRHSRYRPQSIQAEIGERAWQALRAFGLKRIDEATEFELRELRQRFLQQFSKQKVPA